MDVFDKFVGAGDSVCLGEAVIRRYQVMEYMFSAKSHKKLTLILAISKF